MTSNSPTTLPLRRMRTAEAIREALAQRMTDDERVFVIGEDVGRHGGSFQVTAGLLERFGPRRVIDAPLSEAGFVGLAVGAAMAGLRPVVDMVYNDFMLLAMDQLVNQAAYHHYMSGGQITVPLVVRASHGSGRRSAAQHSQSLHAWLAHIPGLKVVMPSSATDAAGLLLSALEDPNPVIIFESKALYGMRQDVPAALLPVPIGKAAIIRSGTDVTVIATSLMVQAAEAVATALSDEVSIEVVDVRTIAPMDTETLVESARRTGRVVVVDEGYRSFGIGAEIAALIGEQVFGDLRAPIQRIGSADAPKPFSPGLEDLSAPGQEQIASAVRRLLNA